MGLQEHVEGWSPGSISTRAEVAPGPLRAFADVLDASGGAFDVGDPVPVGWHWFCFRSTVPRAALGEDGHPREGAFLPPVPQRRRMAAGGRLDQRRPFVVGEVVGRTSSLSAATVKAGRTGEALFATVRHEYRVGPEVVAVEEEDVVYRSQDPGVPRRSVVPKPSSLDSSAPWASTTTVDTATLFRFSALTYNAHRIHYDRDYARDVEGYPDLVVHGPLLALLALELPRRQLPGTRVSHVEHRYRAPAFLGDVLEVLGRPADGGAALSVVAAGRGEAASVTVTFA